MFSANKNRGNWVIMKRALLLAVAFLFVSVLDAHAVQIKRVQSGIANFDTDDITQSIPLTNEVDLTKSIILISYSNDITIATSATTNDQNLWFTANFESTLSITIDRAGSGGTTSAICAASVFWQVIEFTDGVAVQRGISSMAQNITSKNITLPNDLNVFTQPGITSTTFKAIPIIQTREALTSATLTHEMVISSTFPDKSTLQITRSRATSTKSCQLTWQVIEFLTGAEFQA